MPGAGEAGGGGGGTGSDDDMGACATGAVVQTASKTKLSIVNPQGSRGGSSSSSSSSSSRSNNKGSKRGRSRKSFEFDGVLGPRCSQQDVYEHASPLVQSAIDGYRVCIFAYGQTGSGKTYTMEGPEHDRGVNFRAVQELFDIIRSRQQEQRTHRYEVRVTMVEIYNESIRDLLSPEGGSGGSGSNSRGNGSGGSSKRGGKGGKGLEIKRQGDRAATGSADVPLPGTQRYSNLLYSTLLSSTLSYSDLPDPILLCSNLFCSTLL